MRYYVSNQGKYYMSHSCANLLKRWNCDIYNKLGFEEFQVSGDCICFFSFYVMSDIMSVTRGNTACRTAARICSNDGIVTFTSTEGFEELQVSEDCNCFVVLWHVRYYVSNQVKYCMSHSCANLLKQWNCDIYKHAGI